MVEYCMVEYDGKMAPVSVDLSPWSFHDIRLRCIGLFHHSPYGLIFRRYPDFQTSVSSSIGGRSGRLSNY